MDLISPEMDCVCVCGAFMFPRRAAQTTNANDHITSGTYYIDMNGAISLVSKQKEYFRIVHKLSAAWKSYGKWFLFPGLE